MQEDVEQRTVSLVVSAAKFTGREFKNAISKFVQNQHAKQRSKTPQSKSGRVTMRELQKQYGELRSVNIDDNNTRQFERIARKYHVQYKVFRCEKGKYQIFFKAPNDEAMQAAFKEYVTKKLEKAERPSVLQQLKDLQAQLTSTIGERVRHKERER